MEGDARAQRKKERERERKRKRCLGGNRNEGALVRIAESSAFIPEIH
jgi:hypothetical protein